LRSQRRAAEKSEKEEEWEKREERHEYVFLGPMVGGLVLALLGALLYLLVTGVFGVEALTASFFVVVGVIIIAAAVYAIVVAERRHPRP